jgi:hypothetical protein
VDRSGSVKKSLRDWIAKQRAPLPPIADTLDELDRLALKQYETKARSRRAIKLSHRALRDILQMLESYAQYPDLVARGVVEGVHRDIRRQLQLDDPKRKP